MRIALFRRPNESLMPAVPHACVSFGALPGMRFAGRVPGSLAARGKRFPSPAPRPRCSRGRVRGLPGKAALLIPALVTALSCGEDPAVDPAAAIRRDSANIAIVENQAGDRPFDGQIVHVADLATPDNALSPRPWGVVAHAAAQRVFVADGAGRRVAVFDAAGRFLKELGRAGEGPGEFQLPGALAVESCDSESCHGLPGPAEVLVVLDSRRAVLSRWSAGGEFLGEERAPTDYWGPGFAIGPGYFASVTSSRSAGMGFGQRLEVRKGDASHVIHEVAYEMVMMDLPCATMPARRVFAPGVVWARAGDTFYYLNGPGYRIDIWSDGAPTGSFRRPIGPLAVSHEMAVMAAGVGSGPYGAFMRQCGISAEELVDAVGHEEELAPVVGLAVDPGGRLWAARRGSGLAPEAVDILDAEGEYLGTLTTDVLPVAFLSGSRFVGVRLDVSTGQVLASIHDVVGDGLSATGRDRVVAGREASRPRGEEEATEDPTEDLDVAREPAPNPAGLREFRDCPACPLMVELPRGRYLMGRAEGEEQRTGHDRDPNRPQRTRDIERPQVEVEIAYPLALGKYEVTFDEWDHCVDEGGCSYRPTDRGFGRGDRPVIHVSRLDAEEYLAWLGNATGQPYRLPSSAEWEYAARAGTTTARWWGDELGTGRAVCNGCGSRWDDRSTAPVGSFPPNPWGLHDMLSNVSEVVADCWHESYRGHPGDGSPRLEAPAGWPDGECRRATWRGGGWPYFTWTVRAAHRSGGNMGFGDRSDHPRAGGGRGFRVARTMEPG